MGENSGTVSTQPGKMNTVDLSDYKNCGEFPGKDAFILSALHFPGKRRIKLERSGIHPHVFSLYIEAWMGDDILDTF